MAGDPGALGLSEEIARLAEQLQQLQTAGQAAAESAQASSRAPAGGGSSGGSVGSTLLDVFGAGLSLSPLISGIASLFGEAGIDTPVSPLTRFALPPSIQANGE